jgi:hypothetical protein
MAGRKQQTFAKLQRERKVKEKRQLKLEKKQAAAAAKLAANDEDSSSDEALETPDDDTPETPEP